MEIKTTGQSLVQPFSVGAVGNLRWIGLGFPLASGNVSHRGMPLLLLDVLTATTIEIYGYLQW